MHIPPAIRRVVDAVLNGKGHMSHELRQAAFDGESAAFPEPLRPYLNKTAKHAYKIVDRDIEALRAAGYDDDQIFEITICSAVGAGFARLERGLAALEQA